MIVGIADGVDEPAGTLARIAELERAVAARDRFISAVGHELRNSMAPLVMLAETFGVAQDSATLERRMQMLGRNLARLRETLDRVTDVAHLRSEKLVLVASPVELGAVVTEVARECAADAAAASAELRVTAPDPVVGQWDRARLAEIVRHLVANAIRHGGGGPIDITVGTDADAAVLTVADRGRGIELARRATLFGAFDVDSPRRSGGLGVGLWIVHTLCGHMRGTVSLVDEHAPGACFRVALPRV